LSAIWETASAGEAGLEEEDIIGVADVERRRQGGEMEEEEEEEKRGDGLGD
jgi:hypothetical protein